MLLHNSIMCPDGTTLVSKYRHDFQQHKQDDGREYYIDGGFEYQRIGYSDNNYVNLCIYSDDPHEKIREHFEWTRNFDKDMNKLLKPEVVKLKDITYYHLLALVKWTKEGYPEEQQSICG